jgi:RimJ/RimL family protein N-acetyltransferase
LIVGCAEKGVAAGIGGTSESASTQPSLLCLHAGHPKSQVRHYEVRDLSYLLPVSQGGTTLRRFSPADVGEFATYRTDPDLARYQGWSPLTLDQATEFVASMSEVRQLIPCGWVQLAIAAEATDELLGDVGLFLSADHSAVEVGFTLARHHHGRGHATRAVALATDLAFTLTTISEVRAFTEARNALSVAVLQRAGFCKCSEQQALYKGEHCTEFIYAKARGGRPG